MASRANHRNGQPADTGRQDAGPGRQDAVAAGLTYVSDTTAGIRRVRRGRGFSYRAPDGSTINDVAVLDRIRALAVPPAWTDVWICPSARGHLQATGRDARGRKQYRYHRAFRARRDTDKFDRLRSFARALPKIRRRVAADLGRDGLPREKVLAATVRILERTLIRVGGDDYASANGSFGVATLRDRHATVKGSEIRLRFRGKGGRQHEVDLRDRRVAAIVRRCQNLPGQELFQYVEPDGTVRDVKSEDVNDYIRAAAESDAFSAKDFRTWAGTVQAFRALATTGRIGEAMQTTADRLGNTAAVARSAYVHPAVLETADMEPAARRPRGVREERAVLRVLDRAAKATNGPKGASARTARTPATTRGRAGPASRGPAKRSKGS